MIHELGKGPIQQTDGSSKELCRMKDLYAEGNGMTVNAKRDFCGKVTFLQGTAEVCQADYLASADQVTPNDWFKIPLLGEAETVNYVLLLFG